MGLPPAAARSRSALGGPSGRAIEVGQMLSPFELPQHILVMAHHQEGRAVLGAGLLQQFHGLLGRVRVEVACGFVRQHHLGPIGQGPGQCHALLLPGG